jgi:hypothetical protein
MLEHLNVISKFQNLKKNETLKGSVIERYKAARVERLRELYSIHEPLLEKRCIYEHPNDARYNCYAMFPLNENEMNSPFDLPDFESHMPDLDNFLIDSGLHK